MNVRRIVFVLSLSALMTEAFSSGADVKPGSAERRAGAETAWRFATTTGPNGAVAVTAALPSRNRIKSGFADVTPELVLRYRAGRVIAYVWFDTYLGEGSADVEIRFGSEAPVKQVWRLISDGQAALYPDEALALLERMKTVDDFSVALVRRNGERVVASFTPTEVDQVFKALLSAGVSYAR